MPIENQCVAIKKNGERCKRAANNGTTVCNSHGGRAPQVRRKAQQRILEASDRAAYRLVTLMQNPEVPFNVQLAAARDLLDRANVIGTQQINVDVEITKFEQNVRNVVVRWDELADDDDAEYVEDAEIVEDDVLGTREIEAARFDEETREIEKARAKLRRQGKKPFTQPSRDLPAPAASETPEWYEENPSRPADKAELLRRANAEPSRLRPGRRKGRQS